MEIVMTNGSNLNDSAEEIAWALRRALFQTCESSIAGLYVHAVLDPNHPVAPFDVLHPEHLRTRQPAPEWHRVERQDLKHEPELCPWILTLHKPQGHGYEDEGLFDELVARALERCASINGAYVCGWVATGYDAAEFAKHLAKRSAVAHPAALRRVLPWFEPHRLALIEAPEVLVHLLKGIAGWWFIDLAGSLRRVNPPVVGSQDADGPLADPFLRPSRVHPLWDRQERIHQARLVAMSLRKAGLAFPPRPEATLDDLVRLAHEQGLHGEQDVIFFALNCLTLSPKWYAHPAVRQALAQKAAGEGATLAQLLAAQPDSVLEAVAYHDPDSDMPASFKTKRL
jgi:hypothetical protein